MLQLLLYQNVFSMNVPVIMCVRWYTIITLDTNLSLIIKEIL